jgi:ribosomal protein L37AE/L43A
MSAALKPKCPNCGSFYIQPVGADTKKCIDCRHEFSANAKQVAVNNRIKNKC